MIKLHRVQWSCVPHVLEKLKQTISFSARPKPVTLSQTSGNRRTLIAQDSTWNAAETASAGWRDIFSPFGAFFLNGINLYQVLSITN